MTDEYDILHLLREFTEHSSWKVLSDDRGYAWARMVEAADEIEQQRQRADFLAAMLKKLNDRIIELEADDCTHRKTTETCDDCGHVVVRSFKCGPKHRTRRPVE